MKGLLVRVGIDSTDGRWNAPMRLATGEFAYVTITDTKPLRDGMARLYDEFVRVVDRFGERLPPELPGTPSHIDPDFDQLTYGDQGQRAKRITTQLTAGDLLAFFAALRPVDGPSRPLIYALIVFPRLAEIVSHTDRSTPDAKFASRFRARSGPLEPELAEEVQAGFKNAVKVAKASDFITKYEEALPWCDCPTPTSERRMDYQERLRELKRLADAPRQRTRRCH